MSKISVIIVDDSVFMRSVIRDILQSNPDIEVIAQAKDGQEAIEKLQLMEADVMTLDLEMPNKNGISVLEELARSNKNVKVVIVSAYTTENSEITLDCLRMGAVDFLLKPSQKDMVDFEMFSKTLTLKVLAAAQAKKLKVEDVTPKTTNIHSHPSQNDALNGLVVIGSSTGGPIALEKLLSGLKEDFPLPVVISQHLPQQFITTFVERLKKYCNLDIFVAQPDMEVKPGVIYFIPGGHDGTLLKTSSGKIVFSIVENLEETLTPSIDKLMLSVAGIYKNKSIGVILTGMGKDGLLGVKEIKAQGGTVIVQDQESSAVFGMGREVVSAGLADFTLPLDHMATKLQELIKV